MAATEDPVYNLRRAVSKVREAAKDGASVICLPELFRTRYFCQSEDTAAFELAEPVPGPTTDALSKVAKGTGAVVIAPVFEKRAAGVYHNSAAVIDADGKIAGLYRKMHVPEDPGYYEKFYFTPGDLGFIAPATRYGRIGVLICWDQWFPEAARLTALLGASVIFYPTAIGWCPAEKESEGSTQLDSWKTVQRGHAISNSVYVACVNRVGRETPADDGDGIQFWGHSFVCDPQGVVIDEAPEDGEKILYAEIDPARIEDVRRNWPFLRDRRTDAYGGIERRILDDKP